MHARSPLLAEILPKTAGLGMNLALDFDGDGLVSDAERALDIDGDGVIEREDIAQNYTLRVGGRDHEMQAKALVRHEAKRAGRVSATHGPLLSTGGIESELGTTHANGFGSTPGGADAHGATPAVTPSVAFAAFGGR